jgi:hypothetical protein
MQKTLLKEMETPGFRWANPDVNYLFRGPFAGTVNVSVQSCCDQESAEANRP